MGCCTAQKSTQNTAPLPVIQSSGPLPAIEKQKNIFKTELTYEVHSKYPKDSILYKPTPPEIPERKIYRYNCPLCFQFYNHMLQCKRCFNYVCHFCGDDISDRAQINCTKTTCPFCEISPFILEDVNENDPVKKYTDTPYSSVVSKLKFTGGRGFFKQKAVIGNKNSNDEENLQRNKKKGGKNPFTSTIPLMNPNDGKEEENYRRSAKDFNNDLKEEEIEDDLMRASNNNFY